MKLTPVIITLLTIFSAAGAQASISLSCQGSVDKSLSFTADIDSSGRGNLKVNHGGKSDQQGIRLTSKPGVGSDNYSFESNGGDGAISYTLDIRKHLVAEKTTGITTDVNLFIGQPYDDASFAYGLICKISQ